MQTHFKPHQLALPALAEADGIIRACVRHGFCPQTCPTYILLGDENDSPRGRIELIRGMLETGGAPSASTVRHLDQCLSCLSCETTCAARVEYRHLADHARAYIERHFRRPWRDRWLRHFLATTLTRPALLRRALGLARLARPFGALLPATLRALIEAAPRTALAPAIKPSNAVPTAAPTLRVALLDGCVQQVMGAHINAATIRVLERHGCQVVATSAERCCGALSLHMGREDEARQAARVAIAHWHALLDQGALDVIVVNTSGCGSTIKDYGRLFAHEPVWAARAASVADHTRDISEVLAMLPLVAHASRPRLPLAYHDSCSLQHGQRVTAAPRRLLRAVGFELHEVPEGHFCCGSAGTYNLLQPAIASRLGARKASAIESTAAVAVAAGNLGCLLQIGRYSRLPLMHTVELIDWATGGPCPPALAGVDLTPWQSAAPVEATGTAMPIAEEINFWLYAAHPTAAEETTHEH